MAKPPQLRLTLRTPRLSVPYGVVDQGDGWPGLKERYSKRGGGSTTARLACEWDRAAEFLDDLLGGTTFAPGDPLFARRTPMECPFAARQYAQDAVLVRPVGRRAPDPAFSGWTKYDPGVVLYDVTFSSLPYLVKTDVEAAADPLRERGRYVSYRETLKPRERRVPSTGFVVDDATTPAIKIQEVGFVPDISSTIDCTIYEVPYPAGINFAQIEYCTLRCNYLPFKLNGRDRREETLLFNGASYSDDYALPDGTRAVDVTLHFDWRDNNPATGAGRPVTGWNAHLRVKSRTWVRLRAEGSTVSSPRYAYLRTRLFASLFEPPGASYAVGGTGEDAP